LEPLARFRGSLPQCSISVAEIIGSGYPFHSPNSARLAEMPGLMMEW
jgi:hypothetical protein